MISLMTRSSAFGDDMLKLPFDRRRKLPFDAEEKVSVRDGDFSVHTYTHREGGIKHTGVGVCYVQYVRTVLAGHEARYLHSFPYCILYRS